MGIYKPPQRDHRAFNPNSRIALDAETTYSYIQLYGSGALGALGNQVLYWKKIFEEEKEKRPWMIIYTASYVAMGGGVGCVVGNTWNQLFIVFFVGYAWPEFCLAMGGVKRVLAILIPLLRQAIRDSDETSDPKSDEESDSEDEGC